MMRVPERIKQTHIQYRVLHLAGDEAQSALNELGEQGFRLLHTDHSFDGHLERGGLCFFVLERELSFEAEL